jgi:hypothetical protein
MLRHVDVDGMRMGKHVGDSISMPSRNY